MNDKDYYISEEGYCCQGSYGHFPYGYDPYRN